MIKIGSCAKCGGNLTNGHKCPAVSTSSGMAGSMRKFTITCKSCGASLWWKATDFENACDLLIDHGWKSDTFLGGMVCQRCKAS